VKKTVKQLDHASDSEIEAWHDVVVASIAHDRPGEELPSLEQVSGDLTTTKLESRHLHWLATDGPAVAGVASLRLFDAASRDHLAQLSLHVHPSHRRGGLGSLLLSLAIEAARADERSIMVAEASSGTPAGTFLDACGFQCVLSLSLMTLFMADVDTAEIARIAAQGHPGYELRPWKGSVPAELAESFARAKDSMGDAPAADPGRTEWSPQRLTEMAAVVESRGETLLTIAALLDDTVSGFTELVVSPASRAIQYDTAVLPGHRGGGLGLWVKAAMLQWVMAGWPHITEIETDTAADNRYMRAINDRLGYRQVREARQYQIDLRSNEAVRGNAKGTNGYSKACSIGS
jgi:GNAT superfamily N-acetyltransferase